MKIKSYRRAHKYPRNLQAVEKARDIQHRKTRRALAELKDRERKKERKKNTENAQGEEADAA